MYLARRLTEVIRRPLIQDRKSASAVGNRKYLGQSVWTSTIRRPTSRGRNSLAMTSTSGSSGIFSRAAEDLTVGRFVESNDESPTSSKSGSAEITAGSQQQAGQHIRFVFARVELDVNDPLAFGDVNLIRVSNFAHVVPFERRFSRVDY